MHYIFDQPVFVIEQIADILELSLAFGLDIDGEHSAHAPILSRDHKDRVAFLSVDFVAVAPSQQQSDGDDDDEHCAHGTVDITRILFALSVLSIATRELALKAQRNIGATHSQSQTHFRWRHCSSMACSV